MRGSGRAPIYVETVVRAPIEELWRLTQDPGQHSRWDLRFTSIQHLPRTDPAAPQEFRYAVRLLPGLEITGTGRSLGERERSDGTRTSALGWDRDTPLSPLGTGRGYWRYVPVATTSGSAIRFLTGYDYEPGWGPLADRVVRPLLGWATAWSFDRLRLWAERGQSPERSLILGLLDGGARVASVAAVAAVVGRSGPMAAALAAALTTMAVALIPAPATVPRAARCRRRPPDAASARPPSTIAQVTGPGRTGRPR